MIGYYTPNLTSEWRHCYNISRVATVGPNFRGEFTHLLKAPWYDEIRTTFGIYAPK